MIGRGLAARGAPAQARTSAGRARMSAMTASGSRRGDLGAVLVGGGMASPREGDDLHAGGLRRRMPAGLSSTTRQAAGG